MRLPNRCSTLQTIRSSSENRPGRLNPNEYELSYGTLAAQAIAAGYFGPGTQNVGVIDPEFYLTDNLTSMSVFGIKSGNGWTFYASLHTTTKKGITLDLAEPTQKSP
jgi:hypothetical protein